MEQENKIVGNDGQTILMYVFDRLHISIKASASIGLKMLFSSSALSSLWENLLALVF